MQVNRPLNTKEKKKDLKKFGMELSHLYQSIGILIQMWYNDINVNVDINDLNSYNIEINVIIQFRIFLNQSLSIKTEDMRF